MNGPEHYRQAEILAGNAWQKMAGGRGDFLHTPERRAALLAAAQVHATLALAAATAEANPRAVVPSAPAEYAGGDDYPGSDWWRVLNA